MGKNRVLASGMLGLLLVFLGITGAAAQDGTLGGKLRVGGDVTIPSGETVATDLYIFGGTIRVDGTIQGDLVASGGQVVVGGNVSGDVIAAGGTVDIRGRVDGDVRLAGGTVTVDGSVAEDALAAGGQVRVASNGSVGEDFLASAGQLAIDGTVTGNVEATAGAYTRNGTVGGSENVTINQQPGISEPTTTDRVLEALRYILTVVAFGLLALWLAPRFMRRAEAALTREPVPALGWGLAALLGFVLAVVVIAIVMVIVAVILGLLGFGGLVAIDIVGGLVAIGGLVIAFAIVAGFLADAIVGFTLARVVAGRGAHAADGVDRTRDLGLLVVGAIIVAIAVSLPIVGPWIKLVVVLFGVGALALAWWHRRREPAEEQVLVDAAAVRQGASRPMP